MMNREVRHLLVLVVVPLAFGAGVWALLRFTPRIRLENQSADPTTTATIHSADPNLWARSMERVKEDRGETGNVALEIPPELRHYEDRHWFLATQVAEVKKNSIQNCQDFLDVAAMISRGDLVPVPVVTDDYVLFGVGARADQDAFTRYEDDHPLALYDETQLANEYQRLANQRSNIQSEVSRLNSQIGS